MTKDRITPLLQPGESVAAIGPIAHGSQEWAYGYGCSPIDGTVHEAGNSVVLDVEPEGATEPVLIVNDIVLSVQAISGEGYAVVYSAEDGENVRTIVLDATKAPLALKQGDAYYYLNTGEDDLILRDDSTPAFVEGDEILLTATPEAGQPETGRIIELPNAFWQNFEPGKVESLGLSQSQVLAFFEGLQAKTANIPELEPALEYATKNPEHVFDIYRQYVSIVRDLAHLSDGQIAQVHEAWSELNKTHVDIGSASEINSADVLASLDDSGKEKLADAASQVVNPDSEYFEEAVAELVQRMEGGHLLKVEGKTPVDGDPEADKVIWGHTQITNPEALVHFTISHYLERYLSRVLSAQGVPFASSEKDFFLNAMTDVILLDHFAKDAYSDIFDMRTRTKENGGLGWLKEDRISAFATAA